MTISGDFEKFLLETGEWNLAALAKDLAQAAGLEKELTTGGY